MDHNFFRITQYVTLPGPIPQPATEIRFPFHHNLMPFDYFELFSKFQEHQHRKIYYSWVAQNLISLKRECQASVEKSKLPVQHDSNYPAYPPQRQEISKFAQEAKKLYVDVKQEESDEKERQSRLRAQITQMVSYFIDEHGQGSPNRTEQQRSLYAESKALLELFDTLKDKYSSARKCREDMIRLALRKALTWLRDSLRDQLNISAKEASLELCRRYFGVKSEGLVKIEDISDEKDQEDDLSFLLPYKKNSKYSTPNMCFVREIFASKEFNQDYMRYLSQLDEILELDNNKKVPKFIDFLVECVQRNLIYKVKTYKRLPWLKTWLKATKVVAVELLDPNTWKEIHRKKLKSSRKNKPDASSGMKAEILS